MRDFNIVFNWFRRLRHSNERFNYYPTGFHGDEYLLKVVEHLLNDAEVFIETGTNVGTTLAYVANSYPELRCLSCEPDSDAYKEALKNTRNNTNVTLFNSASVEFLKEIAATEDVLEKQVVFWLDAHGYGFEWPLRFEIDFISRHFKSPIILIDDFLVPDKEMFLYDDYDGQVCSFDYIREQVNFADYQLFYPDYEEKTSKHHPLKGWGLIIPGYNFEVPAELSAIIRCA